MPEPFLHLSAADRLEALEAAALRASRPAGLLEKNVWVVWTLDTLFLAEFGASLTFKGGTSLSKVYGVIDRFSEDVDLTAAPPLVSRANPASGPLSRWSPEE